MIIDYLKGLAFIVALVGYVIAFNYFSYKITKTEQKDLVRILAPPFLYPFAIALILLVPLILGRELF